MNKYQMIAKWLLRLSGSIICLSCIAILIPLDWMNEIHSWLGLGETPRQPIFEYLARSLSAMYFAHGAFVLAVSFNVVRYWPLVGLLGCLNVVLGVVLVVTDFVAPMPWYWTLMEGPPIVVVGGIFVFLWRRGSQAADGLNVNRGV